MKAFGSKTGERRREMRRRSQASPNTANNQSVARLAAANQPINPITMADTQDRVALNDSKPEVPQATEEQSAAADLDPSLDTEMQGAEGEDKTLSAINMDGASDEPQPPQIETRMPAKKDVALRDFMSKMDEYAPIVCYPLSLMSRIAMMNWSSLITSQDP